MKTTDIFTYFIGLDQLGQVSTKNTIFPLWSKYQLFPVNVKSVDVCEENHLPQNLCNQVHLVHFSDFTHLDNKGYSALDASIYQCDQLIAANLQS